jgi:hypothetical protein
MRFFSPPNLPDMLYGPPKLVPGGQGGRGVMITTHLHLALRLRMNRIVQFYFTFTPSCVDGETFTFAF